MTRALRAGTVANVSGAVGDRAAAGDIHRAVADAEVAVGQLRVVPIDRHLALRSGVVARCCTWHKSPRRRR